MQRKRREARALLLTAVLCAWTAGAPLAAAEMPPGWVKAGSHPNEYDMGLDTGVRRADGKASAFVKAIATELHGFGTLMQMSGPGEYRGKRVRLSGYVKSTGVQSGWAGLWFRIDGAARGEMLGFDNMQSRPIKGTTNWTRYEIVLDVPNNAAALAFGLLLAGNGQVWMDDLRFEVVTSEVPLTAGLPPNLSAGPQNLNFEKE